MLDAAVGTSAEITEILLAVEVGEISIEMVAVEVETPSVVIEEDEGEVEEDLGVEIAVVIEAVSIDPLITTAKVVENLSMVTMDGEAAEVAGVGLENRSAAIIEVVEVVEGVDSIREANLDHNLLKIRK